MLYSSLISSKDYSDEGFIIDGLVSTNDLYVRFSKRRTKTTFPAWERWPRMRHITDSKVNTKKTTFPAWERWPRMRHITDWKVNTKKTTFKQVTTTPKSELYYRYLYKDSTLTQLYTWKCVNLPGMLKRYTLWTVCFWDNFICILTKTRECKSWEVSTFWMEMKNASCDLNHTRREFFSWILLNQTKFKLY